MYVVVEKQNFMIHEDKCGLSNYNENKMKKENKNEHDQVQSTCRSKLMPCRKYKFPPLDYNIKARSGNRKYGGERWVWPLPCAIVLRIMMQGFGLIRKEKKITKKLWTLILMSAIEDRRGTRKREDSGRMTHVLLSSID